ncbi:MAG: efflux RND transporter periplasmic adaptor subunit [Peptostreptococcaceae bacterium]|nr:efflux RND transporter periplasmic adaptor subunit [Peptostreptococcaceae bacterium]
MKKQKKSWKKVLFFVLLILLVGGGFFASKMFASKNSAKLFLSTHTVEQGKIEQKISATGVVKGSDSAEIGSNLNFEFIAVNVKEGDIVKKGDVLGVLDSKSLRSDYNMAVKDLQIAQAQLKEQRETAQLAVEERLIDYNEAKRQNDIMKQLFDEGGASNDELVQSNIALEKATFALNSAKDALRKASSSGSASLGIDIKQEMISDKRENLNKANITSPIDGTVTRVNAKIGRIPTAQDQTRAMFIIENLDELIINVSIGEYDISNVEIGQKVIISSDILKNKTIEGKVTRIAPTGEMVQGANSREMRIPVEIKITDKGNIIAGVNAKTEIIVASKNDVISVPLEALLEIEGEQFVLVGNDNVIKRVKVETGIESITDVEITSGDIKAGDIVITNPSADYKDGDKYQTQQE